MTNEILAKRIAELENQLSNERIKYQRLEETHLKAMEQWKQESPAELDFKLLALTNERDALAAHNSELVSACKFAIDMFVANDCNVPNTIETLQDAIEGNPQQCLAQIRAEAGRAGFIAGCELIIDFVSDGSNTGSYKFHADEYADKVRQGGDE